MMRYLLLPLFKSLQMLLSVALLSEMPTAFSPYRSLREMVS